MHERLIVPTPGRGLIELSARINQCLAECRAGDGLLNLFLRHTSASLILCENADPDVLQDLEQYMQDLVTDGDRRFIHRAEGSDDMAAHIRSVLTANSLSIPVRAGRLALGTWQGVFLWEHRYAPHQRELVLTLLT